MTDEPIDIDARRSAAGQRETEMRRRMANGEQQSTRPPQAQPDGIDAQMLAEPARSWVEVMEKWRFLLDRYAATPEAGDARLQKLIGRALGDMERLRNREERK